MNNKPGGGAMRLSGLRVYSSSAGPVARARRVKRRPREKSAEWDIFPEAMLRICSGYRLADGLETRSPGKAR
ncbi:hypothetical protein [Klebsiella michiganensis]|uniref:hypothetical protein n=1 Tax=Klebsiella michiganensis TaxID=1134687 RepID=UPI0030093ABA